MFRRTLSRVELNIIFQLQHETWINQLGEDTNGMRKRHSRAFIRYARGKQSNAGHFWGKSEENKVLSWKDRRSSCFFGGSAFTERPLQGRSSPHCFWLRHSSFRSVRLRERSWRAEQNLKPRYSHLRQFGPFHWASHWLTHSLQLRSQVCSRTRRKSTCLAKSQRLDVVSKHKEIPETVAEHFIGKKRVYLSFSVGEHLSTETGSRGWKHDLEMCPLCFSYPHAQQLQTFLRNLVIPLEMRWTVICEDGRRSWCLAL